MYRPLFVCILAMTVGFPFHFRWAIPVCMAFSWVYMRPRYHWTQVLVSYLPIYFHHITSYSSLFTLSKGVLICIGGLGMLVGSDHLTDKSWTAIARGKGDAFMIAGATLYGFSASTSFWTRHHLHSLLMFLRPQRTPPKSSSSEDDLSTKSLANSECGDSSYVEHKLLD